MLTEEVPYIKLAEELGVGSTDLEHARLYIRDTARKKLPKS